MEKLRVIRADLIRKHKTLRKAVAKLPNSKHKDRDEAHVKSLQEDIEKKLKEKEDLYKEFPELKGACGQHADAKLEFDKDVNNTAGDIQRIRDRTVFSEYTAEEMLESSKKLENVAKRARVE